MSNKLNKDSINFEFEDNSILINLFGRHNQNLLFIEKMNNVSIDHRGNKISIVGNKESIHDTHMILKNLYENIKRG